MNTIRKDGCRDYILLNAYFYDRSEYKRRYLYRRESSRFSSAKFKSNKWTMGMVYSGFFKINQYLSIRHE